MEMTLKRALPKKARTSRVERMDDDLDVKGAFDNVVALINGMDMGNLTPKIASGITKALKEVDEVLQLIF